MNHRLEPKNASSVLLVGQSVESNRALRPLILELGLGAVVVTSLTEALAAVQERSFDAAVVHLELLDGDGLELVWRLHGMDPPCCTVLTADDLADAFVREAFHAGVVACLRTPLDSELLRHATRRAVDGTRLWRRCLRRGAAPMTSADTPLLGLTPREQQVLRLLLQGCSTAEMAEQLDVTPRTVKYHVTNLLRKTGVSSRIELLASLRRA